MAPIYSKEEKAKAHTCRAENKCNKNCFGPLTKDNIAHKILSIDRLGNAKKEHTEDILNEEVRKAIQDSKMNITSTKQHVTFNHKASFYGDSGKEKEIEFCQSCFQYL